jgi:hypothetical protein
MDFLGETNLEALKILLEDAFYATHRTTNLSKRLFKGITTSLASFSRFIN